MSIPDDVAKLKPSDSIPEDMARLEDEADVEVRPYYISFIKYNEKMCQIPEGLVPKQRKNALVLIKKIGTKIFSENDLNNLGVQIDHVVNAGDYSRLFKGLHDDVELKEARLSNGFDDDGRLFFYTLPTEKIFCFVAFRGTHIDTSHR